jgi:hypothetical protein
MDYTITEEQRLKYAELYAETVFGKPKPMHYEGRISVFWEYGYRPIDPGDEYIAFVNDDDDFIVEYLKFRGDCGYYRFNSDKCEYIQSFFALTNEELFQVLDMWLHKNIDIMSYTFISILDPEDRDD